MSRRKGELTTAPFHRRLDAPCCAPAEKARGLANSDTVRGRAKTLSVAPLIYFVRQTDEAHFVIFCFKTRDDAQILSRAFRRRASGGQSAARAKITKTYNRDIETVDKLNRAFNKRT
jgi:predicted ABC-type ATPase